MGRCLLVDAGMDQSLWAEAAATAAYLRNRCPSKALNSKTPYEIWTGYKPKVNHFNVFGSYAVALNNKRKGKFETKGTKMVMVGYSLVLLEHFLGMEVNREGLTGDISLSQAVYIQELLQEYRMENCKPASVPLTPGFQIKCSENCNKVDTTRYQSLIGALLYLALTTRPDILHSVFKLAQRNSDPHVDHFTAAKNILRYLKGTQYLKLRFCSRGKHIIGYADADRGGCSTDRKSYSGSVSRKLSPFQSPMQQKKPFI